ncbi:MAG TPA: ABC transporter permease [Thermoanaerobaculia bacterium]|nr:ABC transporter permease [Thermoanaerobaculia bacterium]
MRLREALPMALEAIRTNKLRSVLTLVGIVAGVASIIAVMTGISVIQSTMESELSVLGTQTFQVQKWPAGNFGPNDVDWRKIQARPPVTLEDAQAIRDKVRTVDLVGSELWRFGASASYRGEKTEGRLWVVGGDPQYAPNNTHLVGVGRNLTDEDVRVVRKVAVIGYALAQELFPFIDPIGQVMKIDGRKYTVVGIFEEKKSAMGGNFDNYILIPVTTWVRAYGWKDTDGNRERSVNVTVRAKSPELLQDAIEETRAVLRVQRGVRPGEDDNFDIFTNDSQIKAFNRATMGVKLGAFVVGIIALVVAGIGIMNIMLVSVTERTREIGIRKALGAKRRNVLVQFLLEAILLCNLGGALGVLVGFGLGNVVTLFTDFPVHVPVDWAVYGLLFCTTVGLTFGMWPALKASKLAPIEALRWE